MDIPTLLSAYFAAIDDKRLDTDIVAATFLPDGRIVRPDGVALTGPVEILDEQTRSFARFRATHHMLTDHVVTRSGDTAQVRANMQAMHLWNDAGNSAELETHFVAGGVLRAGAEFTPDGWRLSELTMRPTWRTGATTRMFLSAHR
ncbi:nuclear transport factor 2 family protein [Gordonia sp. DT219]|uniref:nuclear transport factor 2 family protein n=1 Tax=Gordonia sp. DT219 TaxID=3416658 RepID=UPI003CF13AF6